MRKRGSSVGIVDSKSKSSLLDVKVMVRMNRRMKELLEELAEETGATSIGELIREAIEVYAWLLHKAAEGKRITIVLQRNLEPGLLVKSSLILKAEDSENSGSAWRDTEGR